MGVAVFLVSLALVLVVVEVASRKLLPNRYFVWPPNFSAKFDAGEVIRHGVDFPGKLTINSDGMRASLPEDDHDYRILAVGGSTTICVYLDDAKAWPRRLQDELNGALGEERVWVGNVGRPGHSTDEHILQAEMLLMQNPEIDALVLLVGINDFLRFLPRAGKPGERSSWAASGRRARLSRAFSFYPGWDGETPWYRRNFVTRISRLVSWHPLPLRAEGDVRPMGEKGEWLAFLRRYRARASALVEKLPDLRTGLAEYEDNLNRIVDVGSRQGVRVVLVTQPTLWRAGLSPEEEELLWAGGPPWNRMQYGDPYYSAGALAQGMQRYNAALLGVCRERGVECLDAAGVMPRTMDVFYDDAHFTEAGSAMLAGLLAEHLLEREAALRTGEGA